MPLLIVFLVLSLALAFPGALHQWSLGRFLIHTILAAFWIVTPLFFFIASAGLEPNWQGECQLGWLDCFHQGKLALTPLVQTVKNGTLSAMPRRMAITDGSESEWCAPRPFLSAGRR